MQITNPAPTDDQKWNWRSNVEGGFAIVAAKEPPAVTFWRNQVKQWWEWNQQNPGNQRAAPADETEGPCTFKLSFADDPVWSEPVTGQANAYWFADAITIKAYGGASGGNYIAWKNAVPDNPQWGFNKASYDAQGNIINDNVVYEVCTCATPSSCEQSGGQ